MERKDEGLEDPVAILDRRLASGEIDRGEYDEIRGHLVSPRARGRARFSISRTGWVLLIVLGVVVAFAITSAALTYGPWRSSDGTMMGGWGDWRGWGGPGGMMGGRNNVVISGYAFYPQNLTVPAGTTVTWVNMDFVEHTVSFGTHDNPTGVESPLLGHMGSYSYAFMEPGTYEYHCDPHPYMTGTVIVEG